MEKKKSKFVSDLNEVIRENTKYYREREILKEENKFIYNVIFGVFFGVFTAILLVGFFVTINGQVSYETELDCTTGDVDFTFDNSTNVFNMSGIDGLRCKVLVKGDMPAGMVKSFLNGVR